MCYTCLEHLGRAWRDLWATCHKSRPVCTLTGGKYIHTDRFVGNMSHHLPIIHQGMRIGHIVVTNNHQVLAVVVHQPWGEIEILRSKYPEIKEEE